MSKKIKISKLIRLQVYKMFDGKCAYCGVPITYKELTIDHKTARWHRLSDNDCKRANITRGTDDIDNLFPACKRCNTRKSTLSIEKFREEIRLATSRLLRDAGNYKMALDFGLVKEIKDENNNIVVEFYFEKYLKQKNNE